MANNEDHTLAAAGASGKVTTDEKIEALMKVVQDLVRQREEEDKLRAHTYPMFDNEGECSPKPKVVVEPIKPSTDFVQPMDLDKNPQPKNLSYLAKEPILLNSRIEALEKALRGIRKSDDLVDMSSLSLFPKARMPSHFRMPELEKFDGMGCPKTHLKMYVRAMQPRGADDELLAQMFHETLAGSALKWFLALDESRIKTWEDVCTKFSNHYRYNTDIDITRRDLETTKQEPYETFSAFIMRWRAKASQMINRPADEEQIQILLKSLSPIYHKHLFAQYFPNFKSLIGAGIQVEDAIVRGNIKVEQPCKRLRTTFNEGSSDEGSSDEVNTIIPPTLPSHPPRQFAELCKPLDQILEILKDQKLLQPLEPRPLPKSIPKSFNRDEYCNFHQYPGHSTNQCYRLRHEIQDLIDRRVVSPTNFSNH